MKYSLSLAGGTFDQLHAGHEAFLRAILAESSHVLLGITSDNYVHKMKNNYSGIQSYEARKRNVHRFLKSENATKRLTIAKIDSALYPKNWELLPIEVIFVTEDTVRGAEIINQDRRSKDLKSIPIVVLPTLLNSKNRRISSMEIRQGSMDKDGESYMHYLTGRVNLILPTNARKLLKEPWGDFVRDEKILLEENPDNIVAVGDIVSQTCNELGIQQKLSVVDFIVQRERYFEDIKDIGFTGREIIISAKNPAGHISPSLQTAVMQSVALLDQPKRIVLVIDGEEDLAVIPILLAMPLGVVILYGQPNLGMVRLPVTVSNKQKALHLLNKFTSV